jgi:hypothetical protein
MQFKVECARNTAYLSIRSLVGRRFTMQRQSIPPGSTTNGASVRAVRFRRPGGQ